MSRPDPARATLNYALADAEGRVESATRAIVRFVSGGCKWHDDRVRKERAALERACADLEIILRACREIDRLDAELRS